MRAFVPTIVISMALGIVPVAAAEDISVSIEQNGVLHPMDGGNIRLDRAPFTLVFRADDATDHFQVHAGFTAEYARAIRSGASTDTLEAFMPGHGMAEGSTSNSLFVRLDSEASHFWFRPVGAESRFHTYAETTDGWTATRVIKSVRLFDYPRRNRVVSVEAMRKPLYLSIIASDNDMRNTERVTARLLFRPAR